MIDDHTIRLLQHHANQCDADANKLHAMAARIRDRDDRRRINALADAYARTGVELRNIAQQHALFSDPNPDTLQHARTLIANKHRLDQQLSERHTT